MKTQASLILITCSFFFSHTARADRFGIGANQFGIEFVSIDNPADLSGDPNPAGKVGYAFRIGKHEVSRDMIMKANFGSGLGISLDPMLDVTGGPRPAMPATGVTWFEAAQFVNWLNTSTGHTPAYKFNDGGFELWQPGDAGYNPANPYCNSRAFYFLPSVDEWYKAAYFDPTARVYFMYPTGSNTAPAAVASGAAADMAVYGQTQEQGPADVTLAGGLSPYGTMGQGGNVWEWEETEYDLVNDTTYFARGIRGSMWYGTPSRLHSTARVNGVPRYDFDLVGFRVASVPEPSTFLLGALGAVGLLLRKRCRTKASENGKLARAFTLAEPVALHAD